MRWMRITEAADYAKCSTKVLYAAIRVSTLKAARIGAGRNVIVCEEFVDEWLQASARERSA